MGCGIVLTILQSVSEFFKAYAFAKGETIGEEIPERILLERECNVEVEEKKTESDRQAGFSLAGLPLFFCLVEMKGSPHV